MSFLEDVRRVSIYIRFGFRLALFGALSWWRVKGGESSLLFRA